MADLRELYQEVILDHNRKPRNFRRLGAPTAAAASSTVFPLSAAVIIEAEALDMAQPDPWKAMSRSVSPSTSSSTEMRSPQSGL